jgi:hypothetical protein
VLSWVGCLNLGVSHRAHQSEHNENRQESNDEIEETEGKYVKP